MVASPLPPMCGGFLVAPTERVRVAFGRFRLGSSRPFKLNLSSKSCRSRPVDSDGEGAFDHEDLRTGEAANLTVARPNSEDSTRN